MSASPSSKAKASQDFLQVLTKYPSLIQQEESVGKTPYQVSAWLIYLEEVDGLISDHLNRNVEGVNSDESFLLLIRTRDWCARRAVNLLPKSYKLWKSHWEFIIQQYKRFDHLQQNDPVVSLRDVVQLFERALMTLHYFPRVWIEYLQFMHTYGARIKDGGDVEYDEDTDTYFGHPTSLRRLANRALEALPVTQHDKIWPVLLKYYQNSSKKTDAAVGEEDVAAIEDGDDAGATNAIPIPSETKVCMLRRYLQFNPLATKDVADFGVAMMLAASHWRLLVGKEFDQPL